MKKVLFIAYFFPPLANSGTQRPLKFANYLPDFGWEPYVMTVADPPDQLFEERLVSEIRPGTHVTRVPMLSDVVGGLVGSALSPVANRQTISTGLSWRLRSYFRSPDLYALWRPTAVRAARRLSREIRFDAVWATGFPWTSLLIGRDVSRKTGIPFVADFRDPWSGEDLFEAGETATSVSVQKRLERSVLAQARGIVGLAASVTEDLRRLTPDAQSKCFATIYNGFDSCDLKRVEVPVFPRKARYRVVYTGVWKDGYGLEELYQAIRHLHDTRAITPDDLEVIAAGFAPGWAAQFGVERYVNEIGRLSHGAALGLMRTADILFMPVAEGKRRQMHLPGKLYEYAASERPILATADASSEVRLFFDDVGGGIVVPPNDISTIAELLCTMCKGLSVPIPPLHRNRLERYERKSLTRSLAEMLDEIASLRMSAGLTDEFQK